MLRPISPARRRHDDRPLVVVTALAVALATAFRLWIALRTVGSNDMLAWRGFAEKVGASGLLATYVHDQSFNHPPLMGYWATLALWLSKHSGLPFNLVFKVPPIAADALAAAVLWRAWRWRGPGPAAAAAILFAWNPVSILVSAYHGNTDCMLASLCLLSAYAAERPGGAFWSGLAAAGSVNVKVIAALVVPAFALHSATRRDFFRFVAGFALGMLPYVPVVIAAGEAFYRNALAYNSNADNWGVNVFLMHAGDTPALASKAKRLADFYVPNGRYFIEAAALGVAALGWWRRAWTAYELGALVFGSFLVLTPGFGVQYALYVVPLLFAGRLRWAVAYALLAGLFLFLVYLGFWTGTWPAHSWFDRSFRAPSSLVGLLSWALLVRYVVATLRRGWGPAAGLLAPLRPTAVALRT